MMPLCKSPARNEAGLLADVERAFTRQVGDRTYGVYANSGLILGKADAMLELTSRVARIAAECKYWKSDQSIVNLVRYYEMKVSPSSFSPSSSSFFSCSPSASGFVLLPPLFLKERGADKVLMFPDMKYSVSLGEVPLVPARRRGLARERGDQGEALRGPPVRSLPRLAKADRFGVGEDGRLDREARVSRCRGCQRLGRSPPGLQSASAPATPQS